MLNLEVYIFQIYEAMSKHQGLGSVPKFHVLSKWIHLDQLCTPWLLLCVLSSLIPVEQEFKLPRQID